MKQEFYVSGASGNDLRDEQKKILTSSRWRFASDPFDPPFPHPLELTRGDFLWSDLMSERSFIVVSDSDEEPKSQVELKPEPKLSPEAERKRVAEERVLRNLMQRDFTKKLPKGALEAMMDERLAYVGTRSSARGRSPNSAADGKADPTRSNGGSSGAAAAASSSAPPYPSMLDDSAFINSEIAGDVKSTAAARDLSLNKTVEMKAGGHERTTSATVSKPGPKRKRTSQSDRSIDALLPKPLYTAKQRAANRLSRTDKRLRRDAQVPVMPEKKDTMPDDVVEHNQNPFYVDGLVYKRNLIGVSPALTQLMDGVPIMENARGIRFVLQPTAAAAAGRLRCESPPTYKVDYHDYNSS
jgi:hypothetical protein